MKRMSNVASIVLPLLALLPSVTRSEAAAVDPEDYVQSALRANLLAPVRNDFVIPNWIGDSDRFWYKTETSQGWRFVIVDATSGESRQAFDHRALAAALAKAGVQDVSEQRLPIRNLRLEDRALLQFESGGTTYACRLPELSCESQSNPPPRHSRSNQVLSPDGRFAVSTRAGNLLLLDTGSGEERMLTSDGTAQAGYGVHPDIPNEMEGAHDASEATVVPLGAFWSPDSSTVIAPYIDQRHVAAYPFMEYAPQGSFRPKVSYKHVALVGEKPPEVRWFSFDVRTGKGRRIDFPYDSLLKEGWTSAMRKVWFDESGQRMFVAAFGDNLERAYFFDVDLATGAVRTVIQETAKPRADLNASIYGTPNVHPVGEGKEVIWFSHKDGWGHLYLYDGKTGRLKNQITTGNWLVRDLIHVDERRRQIFFTGSGRESGNPYFRYLYRVNFDGSGLMLLTPERADHLLTSSDALLEFDLARPYQPISPSGEYVVYNHSTLSEVPRATIRRVSDAALISVFQTADTTELMGAGYQPPEEIVLKAADGVTDLWVVLYKPKQLDANKRYPIIDVQYSSPLTAAAPRSFMAAAVGPPAPAPAAPALAMNGFVVVCIDARGTTYRSREFSTAMQGKLDSMGMEDHVAVIKQLAARFPWIDEDRVGILGGSYGGWSTIRGLLEFPTFFKAGVAGLGPGVWHSQPNDVHSTAYQGLPIYGDGSSLRPASDEVPSNWRSMDSRSEAGKLQAKLLLTVGALDENALPASMLQFTQALIENDKDFELIFMPRTSHWNGARQYWGRRTLDFLKRSLGGPERSTVDEKSAP